MTDSALLLDQPLLTFHGSYDTVEYDAVCIAAGSPAGDWSLKYFQHPEDAAKYPEKAERLARVLRERGITDAYAPAVDKMSGLVVEKTALSVTIQLPHGVRLHRNRDVPADGVSLGRNHAFIMSGGGCTVLVAAGRGLVIAAHASRDSMLDRAFIRNEAPPREYASVVRSIIGHASKSGHVLPKHLSLRGFFTLPAEDFPHPPSHPDWGAENVQLAEFIAGKWGPHIMTGPDLHLSIPELIKAQGAEHRFGRVGVEKDLPRSGAFGYTRHANEAMRTARNLVIVHRTS